MSKAQRSVKSPSANRKAEAAWVRKQKPPIAPAKTPPRPVMGGPDALISDGMGEQ